jgi:hypothetical protein
MNNTNLQSIIDILNNLKEMSEIEIQNNEDATKIWNMFHNLQKEIEKVDTKQIEKI